MSWLEGLQPEVDGETWERLQAFEGSARRAAAPLAQLLDELPDVLPIAGVLAAEVDADQAELFARRWQGCRALLSGIADGTRAARHPASIVRARAYLVALVLRAEEILADPGPRALRIRALADYYASQAAVLLHASETMPQPWDLPLRWQPLASGASHALLEGDTRIGPVHANLLRVREARIGVSELSGRGFAAAAAASGAVGGSSGGFFLYSEADIESPSARHDPVGLLVEDGELHTLPLLRRGALVQRAGRVALEVVDLVGETLGIGGRQLGVVGYNRPGPDGVLYNRAWGRRAPRAGVVLIGRQALPEPSDHIPVNGAVLCIDGDHPGGGPVHWQHGLEEAVAGGPFLVRDGVVRIDRLAEDLAGSAPPVTFSQDETFDQNLLPRLAVGLDLEGALWMVAVDGRDLDVAPGLTLHQTGRLLASLGCHTVLNLDGGSSKRLWVRGRGVVDHLAGTGLRVDGAGGGALRPVHTAVFVHADR